MTLQTPNPAHDYAAPAEQVSATPVAHRSRRTLWIILGILAVIGLVAAVAIVAFGSNDEPSAVNSHSALAGEPALISVPGYAYEDPATIGDADLTALAASIDQSFAAANAQTAAQLPALKGDAFTTWSSHAVTADGTTADALLFLASINPDLFTLSPGTNPDTVVTGIAGGMATGGGTVSTETISGESVAVATTSDGTVFVAWYHNGDMTMTTGPDEQTVRDVVTADLTEANK